MLMALAPFPYPTTPLGSVRGRGRRLVVLGLAVAGAGFVLGLTRTGRGWLALALGYVLILVLADHAGAGFRQLARVVAEYALVFALAVTLTGFVMHPPAALGGGKGKTAAVAGDLCPPLARAVAGGACDRLEQLRQRIKAAAAAASPTSTTRPPGQGQR
jgi:hypothetical protein